MRKADNLPASCAVVTKSRNLNFLEPSGPVQACNGTALPFLLYRIEKQWRPGDRDLGKPAIILTIINDFELLIFIIRIEQDRFCSISFPVKLNKPEVRLLEPKLKIFLKS